MNNKFIKFLKQNFEIVSAIELAIIIVLLICLFPKDKIPILMRTVFTPVITLLSAFFVYMGFSATRKHNKIITDKPLYEEYLIGYKQLEKEMKSTSIGETTSAFVAIITRSHYKEVTYFDNFFPLRFLAQGVELDKELKDIKKKIPCNLMDLSKNEKEILLKYSSIYKELEIYYNAVSKISSNYIFHVANTDMIGEYKEIIYHKLNNLLFDFFTLEVELEKSDKFLSNPEIVTITNKKSGRIDKKRLFNHTFIKQIKDELIKTVSGEQLYNDFLIRKYNKFYSFK